MQNTNRIAMLELSAHLMGELRVIYPTILWDDSHVLLVDTGYQGQLPLLREASAKARAPFERLTHVLMTHQDLDHLGGLPAILQEMPQKLEVLAHEAEKPYIQGEKRILRITDQTLAQIDTWPEERRVPFLRMLDNPPKGPVDATIAGGQELPYCGGIIVIDTPGHTPGHISYYHKPTKTLIAGDAMVVKNGELFGPVPMHALDLPTAIRSLKTIAQYDIETVICYHGGVYEGNANARIAELADEH
jgi:glyoxylase-like metal-dependent hydrolase (beta-lactamase superfamily II)